MKGLHEIHETRAAILLRCEELQSYLEITKDRLRQAALQLEELTKVLLPQQHHGSREALARPWLEELAIGQLVDDVLEAERKLGAVRARAAELGISLPTEGKSREERVPRMASEAGEGREGRRG